MEKKNLRKMNRNELIDIIYALQNGEEADDLPSKTEIEEDRKQAEYKKRCRKILRITIHKRPFAIKNKY